MSELTSNSIVDREQVKQEVTRAVFTNELRKSIFPENIPEEHREDYVKQMEQVLTDEMSMFDICIQEAARWVMNKKDEVADLYKDISEDEYLQYVEDSVNNLTPKSDMPSPDKDEEILKLIVMLQIMWSKRLGFPEMFKEVHAEFKVEEVHKQLALMQEAQILEEESNDEDVNGNSAQ